MDGVWNLKTYIDGDPNWSHTTENMQELEEACRLGQIWSRLLKAMPYNPSYWLSRAGVLLQLGYPELAAGDLYKCKMLCEEALTRMSLKIGLAVKQSIEKALKRDSTYRKAPMRDPEGEVISTLVVLQRTVFLYLIDCLIITKCFHDAILLIDEMSVKLPEQVSFCQALRKETEDQRRVFLQTRSGSTEAATLTFDQFGVLRRTIYPWMVKEHLTRSDQTITNIRQELALQSPRCMVSVSEPCSREIIPDISIMAMSDISAGDIVLSDHQMLAAQEGSKPDSSLCNYCFTLLPQNCPVKDYCSESCWSASQLLTLPMKHHYSDLAQSFPPIQLLPHMLAAYIASPDTYTHPLSHPILSRWKSDIRSSRQVPFSFAIHVKQSISILHSLGIDVYSDDRFDTWVILSLLNRIAANMLSRQVSCPIIDQESSHSTLSVNDKPGPTGNCLASTGSRKVTVHSLGYLLPLFNHSCDPNVGIYPENGATLLRARRHIIKGEELCVSYIKMSPTTNRALELIQWSDKCRCSRCIAEALMEDPHSSDATWRSK